MIKHKDLENYIEVFIGALFLVIGMGIAIEAKDNLVALLATVAALVGCHNIYISSKKFNERKRGEK